MLYMASDEPAPRIPWDEHNPTFYVSELSEDEGRVARQFTKPHVAYLGAHTGCSCGFCPEQDDDPQALASLSALKSYLELLLANFGSVELFQCWDGDQEQDPGARYRLAPSNLGPDPLCYVDPPWFAQVTSEVQTTWPDRRDPLQQR
jgi:hypothetical protein